MNRRQFLESAACTSVLSALPVATLAQSASAPDASFSVQTIWDNPEFEVRALEIHSRRMWDWRSVSTAFDLMQKTNMNTLVFHEDDLQTVTVGFPRSYFPEGSHFHGNIIQGCHSTTTFLGTARDYLRIVTSEAKKRNIKFFFEVTELEYPDGLMEVHPEVLGPNGTMCPTTPFWWGFLRAKYDELFKLIPDLAGVIVSPGTWESKLSISQGGCECKSCSTTTPADWYTNLIAAIWEPVQKHGKTLVIRDFAYTKDTQNLALDAAQRVSKDIVCGVRTMPHDFYLAVPDKELEENDRIGLTGSNPQWIEYDTWGQHFAAGLFPIEVADLFQQHLKYARAHGAVGAWFRTDVEGMTDESSFNSFNILNLLAGAMLSQNTTQDIDNVYKAWLEYGLYDALIPESVQPPPVPIPQAYLARLKDFMRASHALAVKAFFVRGFLLGDTRYFSTVDAAFEWLYGLGFQTWVPKVAQLLEPTDENIAVIIAEKDQALVEVRKLPGILQTESLPISPKFKEHLDTMLTLYRENVRGFRLYTICIFLAKQATTTKQTAHAQRALKAADDFEQYRNEMAVLLGDKYFPQNVHRTFDLIAMDSLVHNIRDLCTPLAKA